MNVADMSRKQKVLLYTCGLVEELINAGYAEGRKGLTGKGQDLLMDIIASGFLPTLEEVESAGSAMRIEGDCMKLLLVYHKREKLHQ